MTQTLNPSAMTSTGSLDSTHLIFTVPINTNYGWVLGTESTTQPHDLGFYWEITDTDTGTHSTVGFATVNANWSGANSVGRMGVSDSTGDTSGWLWNDSEFFIKAATVSGSLGVPVSGDTVAIALDVVNSRFYGNVFHGGTWGGWNSGTGNPTAVTGGFSLSTMNAGPYYPAISMQGNQPTMTMAFAPSSWKGTAPSRFGPFDPLGEYSMTIIRIKRTQWL